MRAEPSRQGVRVLRQRTAIFAAVLALGLDIGIANAQAIYFGPRVYDAGLPPHEIMRIVRSTGLAPLTRPARRGPYYVLLATNRSGGQMRVVVDAYAGEKRVISLRSAYHNDPIEGTAVTELSNAFDWLLTKAGFHRPPW